MRDILLLVIFAGGTIYALKQPWVGAVMSVWISLMSPHVEFGYSAGQWPVAMFVAGGTMLGLVITRDKQQPFIGPPVWALLAFWVWICITLPFSFYLDDSLPLWVRSMKIFLLVFVTISLINTKRKLDFFVLAVAGSLGYFGVKGGLFTVATGGSYRVWGPGGFVEGNNELALALVMTIPMVYYLSQQAKGVWAKRIATGTLLILPVTVLGSHSRGALLALGIVAAAFWLKTQRKLLFGVIGVLLGVVALSFMPEEWWSRMSTIQTYDQDASAMGRINAWWNAWNVARANFFGGGFMIYMPDVFARYAPVPDDLHAAHSIYFQVLGEHGFVGLALFLSIGATTWLSCRKLIAVGRQSPELKWAADLGAMIQVSLFGFAVGGAFLSLAYFDLPYYQMAIVVIALRIARQQQEALSKSPGSSPGARSATGNGAVTPPAASPVHGA